LTDLLPISTVVDMAASERTRSSARAPKPPVTLDDIDGRVARRERNSDAVIDAIMVLIQAGEAQPSMADVARLAGVSERSIFRHFETRDALLLAVIERQMQVVTGLLHEIPLTGPLAGRIDAFLLERGRLYEEITPMRQAAIQVANSSDLVADQLAGTRAWLRDELEEVFSRELARRSPADRRDVVAAVDMATSWEAWNLLRTVEGCSVPRARRVLARLMTRLLTGS
jgi:TetR/AcrR family transcriptional regulator, regulator of autoinduction and epiphytic fitness